MKTEYLLLAQYERPIIYAAELAQLLDIGERTLENQIYAQRCPVPVFKLGGKWAAHVCDVAAYIDRQREAARSSSGSAGATPVLPTLRKAA